MIQNKMIKLVAMGKNEILIILKIILISNLFFLIIHIHCFFHST